MSSLGQPGGPVRRSGVGEATATGTAALLDGDVRTADVLARHPEDAPPPASFLRRYARHPLAVVGAVVLLILILAAVFAPLLAPADPTPVLTTEVLAEARQGPSWSHPFGTDKLGRDQLSRVLYGLRVSLVVGVVVIVANLLADVIYAALDPRVRLVSGAAS